VDDIFRHIDQHHEEAIANLIELCSFPTVSAQGRAIKETADWVAGELRGLGFEVQMLPKPEGPPAQPVVYAQAQGSSPKTLLFYDHYDVQPEEPLDLWMTPPFEPVKKDGKLYGRGVSDNKGNIAARLAAIRAWREARGELPDRYGPPGEAQVAVQAIARVVGERLVDLDRARFGHPRSRRIVRFARSSP